MNETSLLEFLARSRAHARFRRWRRLTLLGLVIVVIAVLVDTLLLDFRTSSEPRLTPISYIWVQPLPDMPVRSELGWQSSGRLVRAIIRDDQPCPYVTEGARQIPMRPRPSSLHRAFPVIVCEASIDASEDAWVG